MMFSFVYSLSSSSDEEDEQHQWQLQRQRAKQASLRCTTQDNTAINCHLPRKAQAKHTNAVEKKKPVHKEIVGSLKTRHVVPSVSKMKVEVSSKMDIERASSDDSTKVVGRMLNVKKAEEILEAERIFETKQALTVASLASKGANIFLNESVEAKKETQSDFYRAEVKPQLSCSSPVMDDSKAVYNEMSLGEREGLRATDYRDRNGLISPKDEKIKRSNVKLKHVLSEEERAKRQRLQRSLQNLKPQLSSNGHLPAAVVTPVLFQEVKLE